MGFLFFNKPAICFIMMSIVFTHLSYSQKKYLKNDPFDIRNGGLEDYEEYIYCRNKNNKLKINKRNLRYIYKETKNSKDDYYHILKLFSVCFSNKNIVGKELVFSERVCVHAFVTEYLYKCQEKFKKEDIDKEVNFIIWVLGDKYRNAYNKEFKAHNYYRLKRLKENHLKHFLPFEDQKNKKHTNLVF